jgi:ABC-type glycerol-3-phosphate transport system substrate-binding protein
MRHVRLRWMALAIVGVLMAAAPSRAQQLIVWHDKGDDGVRMIQQMGELYAKDHPGITFRSVSMPTDQWLSRSIAALNTNTAPDVLFNDGFLLVRVQQQTRKLSDLAPQLAQLPADDRKFLSADDVATATYGGQVLFIPMQRLIVGWGVRKSWLANIGETFPKTWQDALRIAHKMQDSDPSGSGRKTIYGMAMMGGNPTFLLDAGVTMLTYGNGIKHAIVDDDGNIVIDRPENARVVIEYLKLYTEYKVISPDTINQLSTDMYQLIEGERVGQFRVGNWNVAKWDKTPPAGDYVIGPFPAIGGGTSSYVVPADRGMAVPVNSPHPEAAKDFVKFLASKGAQQISLQNMGGTVRSDLDTTNITPGLRPFVAADTRLQVADNAITTFPWFAKLHDDYYKLLVAAISDPPADWDAWIKQTADKLRAEKQALISKG